MADETLTLGHFAHKATYVAILQDDVTEAEHDAMTGCLHSKPDAAWKKMHEVMYNHQLEYDRRLSDFLKEAEAMLANMRDQIWTAVCALVESEGVTFKDCLGLTLRILPLLPQIPMDISYEIQILLMIAYCPESLVYRRWHPEQGGVSPFHKEVRASRTLTKVLGGVHHQNSEGADRAPSPAASEGSVGSGGCEAPEPSHAAVPEVSPHTAAGNQVPPYLRPLTMARNPAANPSSPTWRRTPLAKMSMQRFMRMMLKSSATAGRAPMLMRVQAALQSETPSPV